MLDEDGTARYVVPCMAGDALLLKPTYETNGTATFAWQVYDAEATETECYTEIDPTENETALTETLALTTEEQMLGVEALYRCVVTVALGEETLVKTAYFTLTQEEATVEPRAEANTLAFAFTVSNETDALDEDGTARYVVPCMAGDALLLKPTYETNGTATFAWQVYDAEATETERYTALDPIENETALTETLALTAEEQMLGVEALYRCVVMVTLGEETLVKTAYFSLTAAEPANKAVTSITLTPQEGAGAVKLGETLQLVATVLPEDAADPALTWTIDDETIATVDENGLVTPVARGNATITATAADGSGVSGTMEVAVIAASITPAYAKIEPNPHPTCDEVTQAVAAYVELLGDKQWYWNKGYHYNTMVNLLSEGKYLECLTNTPNRASTNIFGGLNVYKTSGRECAGFAIYMAELVFGSLPVNTKSDKGGFATNSTQTWERKNSVPSDFRVKPGDIVRKGGDRHSIFIYRVAGDKVSYIHCNADHACGISTAKISAATLTKEINKKG